MKGNKTMKQNMKKGKYKKGFSLVTQFTNAKIKLDITANIILLLKILSYIIIS